MAVIAAVSCPECEKKFKPKTDVQGKKIKCPFCSTPFVVPAAKEARNGKEAAKDPKAAKEKVVKAGKAARPKPAEVKAALEDPKPAPADPQPKNSEEGLDRDDNPYGVKTQDLARRCPHCAKEMEGANAIICLHCGYNTLTRARGKTEKIIGLDFGRHLKYLAPALGSAVFTICTIIFLLYYTIVSPYHVDKTMFSFTDSEAVRLLSMLIFLFWIFGAGVFCFKKFIEFPKPEDVKKD